MPGVFYLYVVNWHAIAVVIVGCFFVFFFWVRILVVDADQFRRLFFFIFVGFVLNFLLIYVVVDVYVGIDVGRVVLIF